MCRHGHTVVLYFAQTNNDRIEEFGTRLEAGRVPINQPSSQGAISDIYVKWVTCKSRRTCCADDTL